MAEKDNQINFEKSNINEFSIDKREFIEKYGLDNIIALDKETNGIFSRKIFDNDIYMTVIINAVKYAPKQEENEEITYEKFRKLICDSLNYGRRKNGIFPRKMYPDYDFIKGKFREDFSEIFIDKDIVPSLRKKFCYGTITAEDIRLNPELAKALQEKDLEYAFSEDKFEYLQEKLNNSQIIELCSKYGNCLDKVVLQLKEDFTQANIEEKVQKAIYEAIEQGKMGYFEQLPTSFKEKYPELFLPETVSETTKEKFYNGCLEYEDIRRNPKLAEILLDKNIAVGFAQEFRNQKNRIGLENWQVLDLAKRYGRYFQDITWNFETENYEEIVQCVENKIAENIINRITSYNYDDVPEFMKKEHPELFLPADAPQDMQYQFYKGSLTFEMIKAYPEYKEMLAQKNLKRAFPRSYRKLFANFDDNTIIKLGTHNTDTIKIMVMNHEEETMKTWYNSTGGRFIPHHTVMLHFPTNEIDSFLSNGKKWSKLMSLDGYNYNDAHKKDMLKAAYTMGVFKGNDDSFNRVMELFSGVPNRLSREEYEHIVRNTRNTL